MANIFEVKVNQAYIALLGRAADPAGLAFWANQLRMDVATLKGVADPGTPASDDPDLVFALKKLTNDITLNPEWLNPPGLGANDPTIAAQASAIVNGMYQNMFDRDAGTTPLAGAPNGENAYWTTLFTNQTTTASEMAVNIIQGIKTDPAQDPEGDGALFTLKSIAAIYYTENIGSLHTNILATRAVDLVVDEATLMQSIALTDLALGRPVTLPITSLPEGIDFTYSGIPGDFDFTFSATDLSGATIDHAGTGDLVITNLQGGPWDLSNVTSTGLGDVVYTVDGAIQLSPLTLLPPDLVVTAPAASSFTLTAQQADELVATGAGDVFITNLDNRGVDFRSITTTGVREANFPDDTTLNATTELGEFTVTVNDGVTLNLSATQADMTPITGAGNVVVTNVGSDAVDLSAIAVTGASRAQVPANATLNPMTNLGSTPLTLEVLSGALLMLTSAQANAQPINGAGAVTVSDLGDAATDLSQITVIGEKLALVPADATLNAGTDLGSFSVSVGTGITLTLSTAQADDLAISGAGNVIATDLGTDPVDLSGVVVTGARTTTVGSDLTLDAATDLGTFDIEVTGGTLTLSAAQADALNILGAGGVTVTALGSDAVDLSNVTVTGARAALVPVDATLDPSTDLGTFSVTVAMAATLTLATTQATARSIDGTGNVVITGLGSDAVDFSQITATGAKSAQVSADATLNAATVLGAVAIDVVSPATLTVSATQADSLIAGGTGGLTVAGLAGQALDLSNITTATKTVLVAVDATQNAGTDLTGFVVSVDAAATFTTTVTQAGSFADAIGGGTVVVIGADGVSDTLGQGWSGVTQRLTGGAGADTFNVTVPRVTITDFNLAEDTLNIGVNGEATVTVSSDADFSIPTVTNAGKLIVVHAGAGSDDVLVGTAGDDTLDYSGAGASAALLAGGVPSLLGGSTGITVDLDGANAVDVLEGETDIGDQNLLDLLGQADSVAGFENVIGTFASDTITGDDNANRLTGGGGDDTLAGEAGQDVIVGGDGADTITAGADADEDVVAGLLGIDTIVLTGGAGAADEVHVRSVDGEAFAGGSVGDTVTGFASAVDQIVFLDNGLVGGSGAVDFANSTDTTSGAKGTALDSADLQLGLNSAADVSTVASGNDVAGRGADDDVLVFSGATPTIDLAVDTFDAFNSYAVVTVGADTIVVFDTDWNDVQGREHIMTLTGVLASDLGAGSFEVYTTV